MASVLKFVQDGFDVVDFNDGSIYTLVEYDPIEPTRDRNTGKYDLTTPLDESAKILVRGSTRDDWEENCNAIERYLVNADANENALELAYSPRDAEEIMYSEIFAGWVERPKEWRKKETENLAHVVTVHWRKRPEVEAEAVVIADLVGMNNGLGNAIGLSSDLKGILPGRTVIEIEPSGGNADECKMILASVYARRSSNAFQHILQAEDYSARHAEMSDLDAATDSTFTPGTGIVGQIYTPTTTNKVVALRWEFTDAGRDNFGNFLFGVRYRDRHTAKNFYLSARTGIKVGSTFIYGVETPQVLTQTNDATRTNECGWLGVGLVRTPGIGLADQEVKTHFYELLIQAKSVAGSLEIDYCDLFPVGDVGNGKGLVMAEFDVPVDGNRVVLDARPRFDRAYLTDLDGVKLTSIKDLPEGNQILLLPHFNNVVFFKLLTATEDGFRHDHTVEFDAGQIVYRARYPRYGNENEGPY